METRKIIILLILAFLHHAVPSEKAKEVRLRLRFSIELIHRKMFLKNGCS